MEPCALRPTGTKKQTFDEFDMRISTCLHLHLAASSLVFLTFAAPAAAQFGRDMHVIAPAVIGQTSAFSMRYPAAIAGNSYLMLFAAPNYPGALQLQIPGLTINGLLRVDPATLMVVAMGVLDSSGQTPLLQLPIPGNRGIVGATFDVQGLDVSGTGVFTLSDDDVEVAVAALPGPSMVAIPAGTFQMGSNAPDAAPYYGRPWERPVHAVAITRPFWIGKHEVAQAEWQAVMGSNPSRFPNPQNPVEAVSWNDAMAFCAAMTTRERAAARVPSGYQYRLPTEAEWEYCCRAGTTTEYSVGPSLLCSQANFNYSFHSLSSCGSVSTVNVGGHPANGFGLHDMHGNVWELCLDSWDGTANYPASLVMDPYVNSGPYRVVRGGSWGAFSRDCRSAYRSRISPSSGSAGMVGFRVVLAPILVP